MLEHPAPSSTRLALATLFAAGACTAPEPKPLMDGRVHETDQGFEAVADASIDTALSATWMVYSLLDIAPTDTIEDSGEQRTARGYSAERDVEVSVILEDYAPGATRVSVTAQVGKSEDPSDYEGDVDVVAKPVNPVATDHAVVARRKIEFWDKKFAREVLDRILGFTGLAEPPESR